MRSAKSIVAASCEYAARLGMLGTRQLLASLPKELMRPTGEKQHLQQLQFAQSLKEMPIAVNTEVPTEFSNRAFGKHRKYRPLIASKETSRKPISTFAATLQDQQPIRSAAEKTIEAEPIDMPTPNDRTKLLVLGGNGYVGSHVCKEALERGLPVLSLNRSGRPSVLEPWVKDVDWIRGSVFDAEKWKDQLKEVTAVVSCIGGFGSNSEMLKINGDANVAAINASAEAGVERFVFISAADFNLPFVLKGYYQGKKAAEEALRSKFPYGGVILRPGFIHGTRRVGNINVPLSVIGAPLELLFRNIKPATQLPVVGPLLIPPVKVTAVAKAAVRAAVDNAVPPGALDVWGIIRLGDHK